MRGLGNAGWRGPTPSSLRACCLAGSLSSTGGPGSSDAPSHLLPQGLQVEVQNLKDQVQELHRDLTKHHSLIKAEIMGDVLHRSLLLDTQIASEYASIEGMRAIFQEVTSPRSSI